MSISTVTNRMTYNSKKRHGNGHVTHFKFRIPLKYLQNAGNGRYVWSGLHPATSYSEEVASIPRLLTM